MQLVDFNNLEPQETLNHTSKGNQLKWKYDGCWYKADHMGYEGLAESIVSALLERSSIKYPFVKYEYSKILYHGRTYNGYNFKAQCSAQNKSENNVGWMSQGPTEICGIPVPIFDVECKNNNRQDQIPDDFQHNFDVFSHFTRLEIRAESWPGASGFLYTR